MTNYSVTQVLAYHDLDLSHKQYEVIQAMRELQVIGKKASCEAIADHLGYTPNRVTGRIKELFNKQAIEYDGFTTSKFGKSVQVYKLVSKGQGALC